MLKDTPWPALAAALNVNTRTLHDLRHKPGAPAGRDAEEWRSFLASRSTAAAEGGRGTGLLPGECSYDAAVDAGQITYHDAKIRETVVGEQIANELKRGTLVTKESVQETIKKISNACIEALATLPDLYANGLPADKKAEARQLSRGWVDAIRERLAASLRNIRP